MSVSENVEPWTIGGRARTNGIQLASHSSARPKDRKEDAMNPKYVRVLFVAALNVVVAAGGMALLSPLAEADPGGFRRCPVPPCLSPCVLGAEPEVLCKFADGTTEQTTFACCCCGGGAGENSFKRLK
jgi:hypothetical protein